MCITETQTQKTNRTWSSAKSESEQSLQTWCHLVSAMFANCNLDDSVVISRLYTEKAMLHHEILMYGDVGQQGIFAFCSVPPSQAFIASHVLPELSRILIFSTLFCNDLCNDLQLVWYSGFCKSVLAVLTSRGVRSHLDWAAASDRCCWQAMFCGNIMKHKNTTTGDSMYVIRLLLLSAMWESLTQYPPSAPKRAL